MPEVKPDAIAVRRLDAVSDERVRQLAALLIDCVDGGASVSFMHPLPADHAERFWRRVADGVAAGERTFLVAERGDGTIVGTVQLLLAQRDNQPHRADVAKMLVHRSARRRGKQNLADGKPFELKLIDYITYNPNYSELKLDLLIERASKNWNTIPSVDSWLSEIRGGANG